jgi:poly(3-hydroxyalkanoate) depolymerase
MSSQPGGGPQMVTVRGRHLRIWRREGEPGRPPLLLCNGIGVSLEHMAPFVAALDPAIGVVAFDVPGIGGSPLPKRPYRFSGLARLAAQLVRQLGYDRFDVLGISWGGGLAQQIALQNPLRCRRVVLVSTGTGALMVPARPRVLLRMATPRRHRDRAYLRAVAGEIYGGRIREHPELVDELFAGRSGALSRRGYLYQLIGGVGWTSLPVLPLLRQPTLVLAGDDDPIIPLANAYLMTRLLPRSRLHIYHDGHLGLITSADELAQIIVRFLGADPEGEGDGVSDRSAG